MRFFYIFLISPSLIFCNWEELFNDDSDPSIVSHVNVITGNLQIFSEDSVVSGAIPIHLTRSYSSIGASESPIRKKYDLLWKMEGGWSFLPHLQMLVDPRADGNRKLVVYAKEPNGEMLTYRVTEQKELFDLTLKPEKRTGPSFGTISGRLNPNNNILTINYKKGVATLHLANGGKRIYKGDGRGVIDVIADHNINIFERSLRHYLLEEEISPSGQKTCYEYRNDYPKGVKISTCNASGTKIYASILLEELGYHPSFSIKVTTSDQREIQYEGWSFKDQDYLSFVANGTTVLDEMSYKKTRKSRGCTLEKLHSWGDEKFHVIYYRPESQEDEEKWIKKPHKKPLKIDKVKSVHRLNTLLSSFIYFPDFTEVRDTNNTLRKYYHKDNNLTHIEYFDENENLYSVQKFFWHNHNLIAKVMCTPDGKGIFSKTIEYDSYSNVIKESLYGSFSGEKKGPYEINDNGSLMGSEKYINSFEYDEATHLLIREREGNGLTNSYSYLMGTDLVETKTTFDNKKLLSTQTFTYDEDLLLIKESLDADCIHLEKTYERDPVTGRIKAIEDHVNRIEYTYTSHHQIAEETVFDKARNVLYHIDYKYDRFGHLISKTTPCGNQNQYTYTSSGDLISSKEVGSPETFYTYDEFHRLVSSTYNGKTSYTSYNEKGLIASKTDCYGNTTDYKYDVFDRSILTIFPEVKDTYGTSYRPTMECKYDILGNLTFCKNAKGEIKQMIYNVLSKPLKEYFPDGSAIAHYYTTSGNLKKTLLPDDSCLYYTHDVFGRMTSKKGPLLTESWEYSPFAMTSYTDKKGLKTTYTYDTYGRKIKETTQDRITTYSYDSLNFLSETTQEGITKKEIHDYEGKLIFEEMQGENKTSYTYDKENRKTKISKVTSSGVATDLIEYDMEGRVIKHIDPYENISEFIYEGQTKISLDPKKNETIEKYDALDRIIEIEKKDPFGSSLSKEELFYDKSGNLSRKIISVYQDTTFIKTLEITWEYDFRGLVTKEAQNEKVTLNEYDSLGRLFKKTLPSGVILTHLYDEESRLIELMSSDETVHYQYIYGLSVDPTQIKDLVKKTSLQRSYNLFGELTCETTNEDVSLSWDYDNLGRKIYIALPDKSKIKYEYEGLHLKKVKRVTKDDTLEYEHCYLSFDKTGHVQNELLIHNLGEIKTTSDLLERPISVISPFHKMETNYDTLGLVSSTKNSLFGSKQYKYDPLKQLTLENEKEHHFDSIGNPSDKSVNDYNELISEFIYDANGNPIKKIGDSLQYSYDALGRLISILDEKNRKVVFSYDAYSRLASKEIFQNDFSIRTRFYFYDEEHEIGSTNLFGAILDLKVLGLGIKEDIGAAIAVELEGKVYLPLHDFRGNIIALISKSGEIIWTYEYDAFGNENSEISQNPWGFCSKRKEEGLVYFGKRFYNPEIKRWLTPDPLRYFESPNVYLYTLNSPLNRLDLFGLYSDSERGIYFEPTQFEKPGSFTSYYSKSPKILFCKAILSESSKGAPVDAIVISGSLHKINYTPSEIANNSANLLDHLHEISSLQENDIGLITTQNGISTTLYEFAKNARGHMNRLNDDSALLIGLYNPSYGLLMDSFRALSQLRTRSMNENSKNTGDFLGLIADTLKNTESKSYWFHVPHSEAGLLFNLGYTLLNDTQKEVLRNQLLVCALAPLEPISWKYCLNANNIYSHNDFVTKRYGEKLKNHPEYNIKFVECESKRSEFSAFITDHAALGSTLSNELVREYRFRKTTR